MGISRTGTNFQSIIDATTYRQAHTVSSKQATSAAQNSGAVSQKAREAESGAPKEGATLSESARKALEQKVLHDDTEQARMGLADDAAQARGESETKKSDQRKGVGHGRIEQTAEKTVFFTDDEDEAPYEVSREIAEQFERLDSRTPQQILGDMPDSSRVPAEATVKAQGPKKLARELKDDPKVSSKVESMQLELADADWKASTLAPIKTARDELPLQMDDPYSEGLAKEAALKKMQSGEGELQLLN